MAYQVDHRGTVTERFEAKVERIPFLTCWVWMGALSGRGGDYGRLRVGQRMRPAHQVAYELYRGPIPLGLELDHLPYCRNHWCVNPWHTEAVTHRENVLRGTSPPAMQAKITHCPQGHRYTPENTYVWKKNNQRRCRSCNRQYALRIYWEQKGSDRVL